MINKKIAKVLALRYKIIAFIFIVLAAGLLLLPKYDKYEGIKPDELLSNALTSERYISSDELAHRIITKDPAILLIDVRDEASFKKYTVANAINIPLKSLLLPESLKFLDQDQYNVIFISNDHFLADQAWIISNRYGYKNSKVLDGGINNWFKTIINPSVPSENMSTTEFDLYSFRKAASMHFGVFYPEMIKVEKVVEVKPTPKVEPKKVQLIEKKKQAPAEGGC